jgi:hypothetical protein
VTQKQTTIVKIDNRRQVRKRINAVATAPPPVLRGVSAIQPIIPLPPAPDLYETNILRQRVERLERVREPVREPIREPIKEPAPTEEQRLGGEKERSILLDLPAPQGELETDSTLIPIPTSGRFSELRDRMRLRPVEDTPFRREEPIVEEPDIATSVSSEEPPPTEQLEEPIEELMTRDIAIRRPKELQTYIEKEQYRVLVRGKAVELYGRGYDNLSQSEKNRVRAEVKADVISGSI